MAATARTERRLAAILAADIVGYSRLVEADEAGTLAGIRNLRREVIDPLLAEHKGRIVKLMGDGAIAEFASVVDAVACAVAVQKAVAAHQTAVPADRRIVFRIGVNLGDVVVEDEDLLGDGVNVAARLEQLCEPGGVLVSGTAYDQLQGKLGLPLEFAGEQRVKNIARPVRAYSVRLEGSSQRWRLLFRQHTGRIRLAAAALGALAMIGGGVWWLRPVEPARDKASIAVLPFDNLGGDEATGRLADGLTEDIITDIARFRDLDVIARNSTMAYKGKAIDTRQVGRDLHVRYVLEGSIQRQADHFRVTAQLIEATSGTHVWSDRWDRPVEDIFAVQTELAEHVAARLGGNLGAIAEADRDAARLRSPASLTAYEHFLLAAEGVSLRTEQSLADGFRHAEQAIALDPGFARAYTVRGWLLYFTTEFGADWATVIEQAGTNFRKAVELDPSDAEARVSLAEYLMETGKSAESMIETQRSIKLSPANAFVLAIGALNLVYLGKPEQAAALADRALRLDPYMPAIRRLSIKDAYFYNRQFDKVVEVITAIPEESQDAWARFLLAASYAFLAQDKESLATKTMLISKYGQPSAEQWLNEGWVFARQQDRDLFFDAFRELTLPLCAPADRLAKLPNPTRLAECEKQRAVN